MAGTLKMVIDDIETVPTETVENFISILKDILIKRQGE